jgi:hypothetical protein
MRLHIVFSGVCALLLTVVAASSAEAGYKLRVSSYRAGGRIYVRVYSTEGKSPYPTVTFLPVCLRIINADNDTSPFGACGDTGANGYFGWDVPEDVNNTSTTTPSYTNNTKLYRVQAWTAQHDYASSQSAFPWLGDYKHVLYAGNATRQIGTDLTWGGAIYELWNQPTGFCQQLVDNLDTGALIQASIYSYSLKPNGEPDENTRTNPAQAGSYLKVGQSDTNPLNQNIRNEVTFTQTATAQQVRIATSPVWMKDLENKTARGTNTNYYMTQTIDMDFTGGLASVEYRVWHSDYGSDGHYSHVNWLSDKEGPSMYFRRAAAYECPATNLEISVASNLTSYSLFGGNPYRATDMALVDGPAPSCNNDPVNGCSQIQNCIIYANEGYNGYWGQCPNTVAPLGRGGLPDVWYFAVLLSGGFVTGDQEVFRRRINISPY